MRRIVLGLTLLFVFIPAVSQTPSAEQLRLLQSLPDDQKQGLLEEFGLPQSANSQPAQLEFPDVTRPLLESPEQDSEPRVAGGETVVIRFSEATENEGVVDLELSPEVELLLGANVYELSPNGQLELPGVTTVPLAGLTSEEVMLRLSAEPLLEGLDIFAQILPVEETGAESLSYFGYELFDEVPTTFAPATDVPVPAEYVMGPGDQVRIQLFGQQSDRINVVVSRDGTIDLPDIGPLSVAGMTFQEARDEILGQIQVQMIGVNASITLGELRSIQIFVLGDVVRPGSYTVSGLSTMTNALFVSGGVRKTGSLRRIELKRAGRTIGELDLYDLLLAGDTSADQRLLPGDVIFVPPVKLRVGVEGEVARPAFYELKRPTSAAEVVSLSGGFTSYAYPQSGNVETITPNGDRRIIDADLVTDAGRNMLLKNGDILRVFPVLDRLNNSISLTGHVRRAADYEWSQNLRLTDIIGSTAMLRPKADTNYVLIRREPAEDGRIEVLSADLELALQAPESRANPILAPRDSIIVFPLGAARGQILSEILTELETQSGAGAEVRKVSVGGSVLAPGDYPLENGMRVSDLVRAGGGYSDSAYLQEAELTRYVVTEDGERQTTLINIDLGALLEGDTFADELLAPYDYLAIREIPEWRGQEKVSIEGEVRFPGVYPIKRGETLTSVIERAGGLTDLSFTDGSVFTRESLKAREEEQIDILISRLEADLATLALQSSQLDGDAQQAFAFGQGLLSQLRQSTATGRLVIDLTSILGPGNLANDDITLRDGDRLLIPQQTQEVTVIGEVQYATSHIYDGNLDRDDYLARSGGLTGKADAKRIYVVRANGQVVASSGATWLRRIGGTEILPGDTIVVPLDADRLAPLTLWSSVTQIVYNLAVAVAAVNSF
ncbi:MAG: SLBB domain-containing protein [Pseudomonadota bacterium]